MITIADIKNNDKEESTIREAVEDIITRYIKQKRGDVIFLKPNLVLPFYVPGVCTNRGLLETLCSVLNDRGYKIVLCEGDGGLAAFSSNKAFSGNGLLRLGKRFGVHFLSLSLLPREEVVQCIAGRQIRFQLPGVLVKREFDYFVNVPVLKVHILTKVSLSMKNLWGCIPDPYRIHYHHILDHGIVALWKIIKPDLSIIDGIVAADGNAPINGFPVPLGVIIAGDQDATVDKVATALMGIPFKKVKHLVLAEREGLIRKWDQIRLTQPLDKFLVHRFKPRRRLSNWPGIFLGKYPKLQGLIYHSFASGFFYWCLRRVRRRDIGKTLPKFKEPGWGKDCGLSDFCKIPNVNIQIKKL